jgi:hypothetical protein
MTLAGRFKVIGLPWTALVASGVVVFADAVAVQMLLRF